MMQWKSAGRRAFAVVAVQAGCFASLAFGQGCYTLLPLPPNTSDRVYNSSQVFDVSDDGQVAVGQVFYTSPVGPGGGRQVVWNGTNIELLDQVIDATCFARAISGNGQVVVGEDQRNIVAYRHRRGFQGFSYLGWLPNSQETSEAWGASQDGSVIVGMSGGRPFRWTSAGGMQDLGLLPNSTEVINIDVSSDGNVVVGSTYTTTSFVYQHFVWTPDGGLRSVPVLPGTSNNFVRVSSGGSVVMTSNGYPASGSSWNRVTNALTALPVSNPYWQAQDIAATGSGMVVGGRRLASPATIMLNHISTGTVDAFVRAGVANPGVANWPVKFSNDARTLICVNGQQRAFKLCLPAWTSAPSCDSIDFNRDGLFPDVGDVNAFLSVFSGGACPTPSCGDIDFNNDGNFPDNGDIDAFLRVMSGGAC
jgi:uncharacterized membrane protein